jgi:hypothetical protein
MRVNSDGNLDRNKREEHYDTEKCHKEARRIEVELWDFLGATDDKWDQSHDHRNAVDSRSSIQLPFGA